MAYRIFRGSEYRHKNDLEIQRRVSINEGHLSEVRGEMTKLEAKMELLHRDNERISGQIRQLTEQTDELKSVRRAIRWTVSVFAVSVSTAAAAWKAWFKGGAS